MGKTKFLVMDVDGTLTDGKIYMGQDGELAKAFDIKDGCGISVVMPLHDIVPVIITARESNILANRCKELHITEFHQGAKDKLKILNQILDTYGADMSSVAYAGDDLPDISPMEAVKRAGGKVLCPANAIPEIKAMANFISGYKAGEGAIRDCINYLIQSNSDQSIEQQVNKAIERILAGEYNNAPEGVLPDGSRYFIQEYTTKDESESVIETHRNHIDIQYMLEGQEVFKIYTTNCLTSSGTYNKEKDAEYWQGGMVSSRSILVPGSLVVVYNNQPHTGAIIHKQSERVRKLVCKIYIGT